MGSNEVRDAHAPSLTDRLADLLELFVMIGFNHDARSRSEGALTRNGGPD
jgi:hypothetical protein